MIKVKGLPDLDWLRTFVGYCQAGTMKQASKDLNLTQPAITQHIQKLEHFLGKPLFAAVGRGRRLTRYGESCYERFSKDLSQLAQSFETLDMQWREKRGYPLVIASRLGLNIRLARHLTYDGPIKFLSCSSAEATDLVELGKADIALTRVPSSKNDLVSRLVFTSFGILVGHRDCMGDLPRVFDQRFWNRQKFLAYEWPHPFMVTWLAQMGNPDIHVWRQCADWLTIRRWIEEKQGISVIPSDMMPKTYESSTEYHRYDLPGGAQHGARMFVTYHRHMEEYLESSGLLRCFSSEAFWSG